jgi:hypothetical protein
VEKVYDKDEREVSYFGGIQLCRIESAISPALGGSLQQD